MTAPGRSILVADDEQGIRDLLCYTLEPEGFEVVTVCDGVQAVECLRGRAFDLVILDVHMPRMGGPEALARIREMRPSQRVIVVSSSSDVSHSLERAALAGGASICLFKPIELDDLFAAIEQALSAGG
jgi:CheY-like chemotaxis protein